MAQQAIIEEVQELRKELSALKALLPGLVKQNGQLKIRLHVERTGGERKPFAFTFRAPSEKRVELSATRAAITIALLFDLNERSQGRSGTNDIRATAGELLKVFSPDLADLRAIKEQLRVALFRFDSFWKTEFQESFTVHYDKSQERLNAVAVGAVVDAEILTSDSAIQDALLRLGGSAMIEKLKREKFLFVPAGGRGVESFLKEIYSTPGKLRVLSAYARPSLVSVPPQLVEKYVDIAEAKQRHVLMHKGLEAGTLEFHEIVHESNIKALLQPKADGTFPFYNGMSKRDAIEHIKFIRELVTKRTGYRIAITRSDIPFYVASYVSSEIVTTAFFRLPTTSKENDYSAFGIWGEAVEESVRQSVFNWLLTHPGTTVEHARVVEVLDRLISEAS